MKRLLLALACLLALPLHAAGWSENAAVAELFRQAGATGTFVLHDPDTGQFAGHDGDRAQQRFTPASTFKIANALIGLSLGVVRDVDEPLPYRGPPRPFVPAWARHMGLREAMPLSNVPIFQELARRIGLERMRQGLVRLGYGNGETGDQVDSFWLGGPLRISAVEQTRLLAALARGALPFPAEAQRAVRDILLLEQGEGWKLYGKTGWQNAPGPGVGWWVGWLERDGRVHAFALNMDMSGAADAPKRMELGKASLRALGVL